MLAVAVASTISMSSCSQKGNAAQAEMPDNKPKALVCYFSATGTTAEAARQIARLADADLFEITPVQPYTDADLDWRDNLSRSYVEMHNREYRPEISGEVANIGAYDVIYIGYPNWWNTAPTIINTFIEANDFSGKKVIPFMTSGGSGIANSEKDLHESYPDIDWGKGLLMNNVDDASVLEWIKDNE